jgi:putative heme-binding domain-containing protein
MGTCKLSVELVNQSSMLRRRLLQVGVIVFLVFRAGLLGAQRDYAKFEIEAGSELFRSTCARCHGQDGHSVAGVNLADGRFLQARSDERLIEIIRNGIPGTGMLAGDYTVTQAGTIVAYMRSMAADTRRRPATGDPAKGRAIFERSGECLACHRVNGNGSRVGPDLSEIGLVRRTTEIEESILEPNATIRPENRYVSIVTQEGRTITGRLLNHDRVTVQLIDSEERLRSLNRSDLKDVTFVEDSPMPSYRSRFTSEELNDLLSYLVSLKGGTTP